MSSAHQPLLAALVSALGASALPGCAPTAAPPEELAGLWSTGPAACQSKIGIEFTPDAVEAIIGGEREVLFEDPNYVATAGDAGFRVHIKYDLPQFAGGARAPGAYGVLVLQRAAGGRLQPVSHTLIDPRTGSARMRILDDPALSAFDLTPCGRHPWTEMLRGRASA